MALPPPPVRHAAPYLANSERVEFAHGFHDEEVHGLDRYRWMGQSGSFTFAPAAETRFLEMTGPGTE